jgi:hypothetical protein
MVDYPDIDTVKFIRDGLNNGTLKPFLASKKLSVMAKKGTVGLQFISWSEDSNGNPIMEKVDTVELDPVTHEPGWIITKLDINNKPIVDKHGHLNQIIIADSVFKEKYTSFEGDIYKPTGEKQIFVELPVSVTLTQNDESMDVSSGGYVNISDPDDMYGISKRDFMDTYEVLEDTKKLV